MKQFIQYIFQFLCCILIIWAVLFIIVPNTPKSKKSLLYAILDKEQLLENTKSPIIIFVGGSNVSFGLNSTIIKDSLKLNPINMGIHASIGLDYMLKSIVPFIKENDIIILCPEYNQFYDEVSEGEMEKFIVEKDIDHWNHTIWNQKEILFVLKNMIPYAFSKCNLIEFLPIKSFKTGYYSRKAFNNYGDAVAHYRLPTQHFAPFTSLGNKINDSVFINIQKFQNTIKSKKAKLYFSYCNYQYSSYKNTQIQVEEIYTELKKINIPTIGTPKDFIFEDTLYFNTPYHMTEKGVKKRTETFINLYKNIEKN